MRGFSEEYGSWKTIARFRRRPKSFPLSAAIRSSPWKSTDPAVGSSSRMSVRPSVDFPQPLSPTSPIVSPSSRLKETSSTARTSPRLRENSPPRSG